MELIKLNHFEYRIYNEVYDEIASGKKTIEFRLLNKKTESIKQGDEIQFKVLNNEDKYILVEVTNKYIYDSLEELWNHKEIMSNALNYSKKEFINVLDAVKVAMLLNFFINILIFHGYTIL